MRNLILFILLSLCSLAHAQDYTNLINKKLAVRDTIRFDTVSTSKIRFLIREKSGKPIDSTVYNVNFSKSYIVFNNPQSIVTDSILITYQPLPAFLTKIYRKYDPSIIITDNSRQEQLIKLTQPTVKNEFIPFDGLQTTGSLTRGLRSGNNQNSVVDSELDLRITGKLNDKVSLRASIQDANVPQTQDGYAQQLDAFDQIFIELYSDNWNLRAGDVDIGQQGYQFNNFTKRVQGISGQLKIDGENTDTYVGATGALVRGTFNTSRFTGIEGNQGPYKIVGNRGELFILIISGSERVYVNGRLLTRGENADYIIDYNAGEIRFNATFPITSEMRVSIEYQFSDRNFTRYVGYGNGGFKNRKLEVDAYAYTENDAKNQPLQQNLNTDQTAALALAGDNPDLAFAPSAIETAFTANQILYKKEFINGIERFVFSQEENETLFAVRFTNVGTNLGNYVIINNQAIASIYEYREPINGVKQGNFEPVIRLFTPEQLTIAGVKAKYNPSTKTSINTEIAASKNDLNTFSDFDDGNNNGAAIKLGIIHNLIKRDSLKSLIIYANTDFIQQNFRNVERVYNIEFARDWNLENTFGNQLFTTFGALYKRDSTLTASYDFQRLAFKDNYSGYRNTIFSTYTSKGWETRFRGSVLQTTGTRLKTQFNRIDAAITKRWKKVYVGTKINTESNEQREVVFNNFTNQSQRFKAYEFISGRGDTTKTFYEIGYRNRVNDSLRGTQLQKVNRSNNYFITAQPIKNENSTLRIFGNYRVLDFVEATVSDQVSFNSRIQFQQKLWKNKVLLNSAYETNSASIPRQDFTYVEVNTGQGTFSWIDYNNDGIQDLNEFEVAQFQDQARYVRVLRPNQIFIPTHQNKFLQTITLNPISWTETTGIKKFLSKFYNQTSYQIDRMEERRGSGFTLNPFNKSENELGLNLSFRNSLFFNRGKQHYTTNYTFINSSNQNLQSIGSLENSITNHQLNFLHKISANWLITINGQTGSNTVKSENFANRNYIIDSQGLKPQLSYLFNASNKIDFFYEFENKENAINNPVILKQQNIGMTWAFNKEQLYAINGELRYVQNDFNGQAFSPVGFQVLEGLQPGNNLTWNLLFQKKITKYLDLNLGYNGRASETARTVHTGSVQLKAYF